MHGCGLGWVGFESCSGHSPGETYSVSPFERPAGRCFAYGVGFGFRMWPLCTAVVLGWVGFESCSGHDGRYATYPPGVHRRVPATP
jgi:hypothetical protein